MDQLLFTEVCSEMAYLDFLGSGSLASLLPPCCLHSEAAHLGEKPLLVQDTDGVEDEQAGLQQAVQSERHAGPGPALSSGVWREFAAMTY